jgi:hypothetical protein
LPVVGFTDSDGQRWTFDEVRAGKGRFVTKSGMAAPRAMLRSLTRQYRDAAHYGSEDAVSVTTIIAPIQQTRLLERWNVYVEWDDNLWAAYGSIAHGFFEDGAGEGDVVEHRLVIERGGVKIGGTFDLLEFKDYAYDGAGAPYGHIYQGRDYKITSAYGVKKMVAEGVYKGKPDYYWQAQLYHLMTQDPDVKQLIVSPDGDRTLIPWPLAGKVKIADWALVAISRDWNARQHGIHIGPVEVIPVEPMLSLDRVENFLNQRLTIWKASAMASDAGLPSCSDEETWGGRRCAAYCDAARHCHQADPTLGLEVDDA